MRAENHFLSSNSEQIVAQQPTNKTSGKFKSVFPDIEVIHFTSGHNASPSTRTLTDFNVKVSAHQIISQVQRITQLASHYTLTCHLDKCAWNDQKGLNINGAGKKSRKYILYVDREHDDPKEFLIANKSEQPRPLRSVKSM